MLTEIVSTMNQSELIYVIRWLCETKGKESPLDDSVLYFNLTSKQLAAVDYLRRHI